MIKQFDKKLIIKCTLMFVFLLAIVTVGTGCTNSQKPTPKEIVLATTTSTQDSGLLDVMIPAFEKQLNNTIKVKVIAVGTGQAIEMGKSGDADVLLVHSRKSENEFVAQGYGIEPYDVMYNQFYLVGPQNDPAQVAKATGTTEAFSLIANNKANFVSRGDDSGTHKKEKSIWEKAGVKPQGDWYISSGQGMGETLRMAEEKGGYTLVDEATYLTNKTNLKVLFKGDKDLSNPYGIILVKSTKKPAEAKELIEFFVSADGQKLIGEFAKDKYGKGIFVPKAGKR